MQPVYLTGHQRPVRQVLHNFDGDLLFTCSDDGTVCMYDTFQCIRNGIFEVKSACKSIDITKDSKYLLATAVDHGVFLFNVKDGSLAAKVAVPGIQANQVALAFGDKQFLCLYQHEKRSHIRIFDLANCLKCAQDENTPKVLQTISGNKDYEFTSVVWGPLNKTLYVSNDKGKVFCFDAASGKELKNKEIHNNEIFRLTITHDYTMLMTCSRDGNAKLLHPETFEEIRTFAYGKKPVRGVAISPLFDDEEHQKFHMIAAGGQDAREVALTTQEEGGFEIKLFSIIFN